MIDFGIHNSQQIARKSQQIVESKRSGNGEKLSLGIAEPTAYHRADRGQQERIANRLKPLKTKGRADDETVVGGGFSREQSAEKQKHTEWFEPHGYATLSRQVFLRLATPDDPEILRFLCLVHDVVQIRQTGRYPEVFFGSYF